MNEVRLRIKTGSNKRKVNERRLQEKLGCKYKRNCVKGIQVQIGEK